MGAIQKAAATAGGCNPKNRRRHRPALPIKASEAQFALALPKHVDAGRFMRCALTAINVVPEARPVHQNSVLAGLMQTAQLGLEVADVRAGVPHPAMGRARQVHEGRVPARLPLG